MKGIFKAISRAWSWLFWNIEDVFGFAVLVFGIVFAAAITSVAVRFAIHVWSGGL